ncbi:MAG: family 78 glycoside hydrolase catalytic domain [Pseudonocardia sp.]|nr:family 78 glycoside hydrolase catalytic domain [Pseudonocardia sp.]
MLPNWSAEMIGPDDTFAGAPLLRREFRLDTGHDEVAKATLHATARGVFTASVNGSPVSDELLSPGWSSYEWRLRYRTYDVTDLLRGAPGGAAVLGMALGNGWHCGRLTWSGGRGFYGDLGALAQLEIEFADGHRQSVVTDERWQAGPSAVLANDFYDGETIDARLVDNAWQLPGFACEGWVGVHVEEFDPSLLTPYLGPVVRRQEELRPVRVWTSPAGATLVDMGQNLVGWMRVRVQGEGGATVTLRHAEVLENGELGARPLRSAQATDRFVLSGGEDVFEPTLTFHGFRYVQVDGWPAELTLEAAQEALVAVVVHSDLARIGQFACSDDLLNQLHRNVVWGTRGNFLDVPTDCPQRDERLGWTGDIAVFAPTAAFLFDVKDFLRDWLADLDAEQRAAEGMVGFVVPDVLKYVPARAFAGRESTAIWSDASVWVPWALWQAYGDRRVLEESYASMAAHVRRVETLTSDTGLWDVGFQFGDWLDPTAPPDEPWKAKADNGVVATACLYRSASTVSEAARILGHDGEAAYFAALAERTRAAFTEHYVADDGRIHSDAITVYALAICFDLLDVPIRAAAGDRLATLVAENGHHIATGFAGTPYVCDALTQTGYLDVAYRLLLQRECPSWLYPVTMGATTIWERWDAMLPDGTINPGQMTSFNHYALGAVADWLHRVIGGIAPAQPGYRTVRVAPRPGGGLTWARTSLDTPHGHVAVAWRLASDGTLEVDVAVPDGVTAEVDVPGADAHTVGAGRHRVVGWVREPTPL